MTGKDIFFIGIIVAVAGELSPPAALIAGVAYGMTVAHPFQADARRLSRWLLQASVVALGFVLGRLFAVKSGAAWLITVGTAICGGIAIAAVGPVAKSSDEDMAVSLGTVFLLNSIALLTFPFLGHAAGLSQEQFGLWSALAIHDTSSVVGATARYGSAALAVGATVKLARALWIVPVSLVVAVAKRTSSRISWPWFIGFFCLAALANTVFPGLHAAFAQFAALGRAGLTVTLFLIGTGITRDTVRSVGVRPLAHGFLLWVAIAAVSFAAIHANVVHL